MPNFCRVMSQQHTTGEKLQLAWKKSQTDAVSRGSHSRGRPQLRGQGPLKFCRRRRPTWGPEPCCRRPKVLGGRQLFGNSAMLSLRTVKMAIAQSAQVAISQSSSPPTNFWGVVAAAHQLGGRKGLPPPVACPGSNGPPLAVPHSSLDSLLHLHTRFLYGC